MLLASACGSNGAERQVLSTFFQASRVRDTTAVGNLSEVLFDPRTEGSVQDFEITRVEPSGTGEVVTVNAQVRTPDGQTTPRTLTVTMRRTGGRWLITAIR